MQLLCLKCIRKFSVVKREGIFVGGTALKIFNKTFICFNFIEIVLKYISLFKFINVQSSCLSTFLSYNSNTEVSTSLIQINYIFLFFLSNNPSYLNLL